MADSTPSTHQGVTYILSTKAEGKKGHSTMGENVKLGNVGNKYGDLLHPDAAWKPEILESNIPLGHRDYSPIIGSPYDQVPYAPSGYAANRTPTYGDGKITTVNTWASDKSEKKTAGATYFRPSKPVARGYNTFTT